MAVAKSYGVSKIVAFDIEQSRIDFAVKHYADFGIKCPLNTELVEPLAFATDFVNSVIQEYGLGSGVDLTIEASGADACIQMGVMITKNGGTCKSWEGLHYKLSLTKIQMFKLVLESRCPWFPCFRSLPKS